MLQGDLKSLSLSSLLQIIEADKKSGILCFQSSPFQRRLFFKDGLLVFLISDNPKDFLGHFLVSKGIINEDQLVKALKLQSQSQELIGSLFTQVAQISKDELSVQLSEKIKESFYQLFLLDQPKFVFEEIEIDLSKFPSLEPLSIQGLIMEGTRRFDEFDLLKKLFPETGSTFKVLEDKLSDKFKENKVLCSFIDALKSGKSIDELCMHFHTFEYQILNHLNTLQKIGAIELDVIKESSEGDESREQLSKPTEMLLEIAKQADDNEDYAKVLEVYKDLLKLEPGNEAFRQKYTDIQVRLTQKLAGSDLPHETVIVHGDESKISEIDFTPLDGFILSRINGTWSISEILSVVPAPESEVMQALKKLLDAGIIKKDK